MENIVANATAATKYKTNAFKKKKKKKPVKVVYISNPKKFNTSATEFRALVQELTGQDSNPAKFHYDDDVAHHTDEPRPLDISGSNIGGNDVDDHHQVLLLEPTEESLDFLPPPPPPPPVLFAEPSDEYDDAFMPHHHRRMFENSCNLSGFLLSDFFACGLDERS